jgi:hypothetical protein
MFPQPAPQQAYGSYGLLYKDAVLMAIAPAIHFITADALFLALLATAVQELTCQEHAIAMLII